MASPLSIPSTSNPVSVYKAAVLELGAVWLEQAAHGGAVRGDGDANASPMPHPMAGHSSNLYCLTTSSPFLALCWCCRSIRRRIIKFPLGRLLPRLRPVVDGAEGSRLRPGLLAVQGTLRSSSAGGCRATSSRDRDGAAFLGWHGLV